MQEDVAVKQEGAGDSGVPKIHAQFHTGVGALARPIWDFDGVTQIAIRDGLAIDFQDLKVNLMDVEGVSLERTIFDYPILDCSYLCGDDGLLVGLEDLLFLALDRNVKLDGTVGAAELLGEKELALRGCGLVSKIGKLQAGDRCGRGIWSGSLRFLLRFGFLRICNFDRGERGSDVRVAGRAGGISLGVKSGGNSGGRSAHDELGSSRGWHKNCVLRSGLGERIAIERD